eukprot:scaffold2584_cov141-Skeletonema_menzelii.AAC.4
MTQLARERDQTRGVTTPPLAERAVAWSFTTRFVTTLSTSLVIDTPRIAQCYYSVLGLGWSSAPSRGKIPHLAGHNSQLTSCVKIFCVRNSLTTL